VQDTAGMLEKKEKEHVVEGEREILLKDEWEDLEQKEDG
jgi:hypothetical protein